jgi:hypothetical protein
MKIPVGLSVIGGLETLLLRLPTVGQVGGHNTAPEATIGFIQYILPMNNTVGLPPGMAGGRP